MKRAAACCAPMLMVIGGCASWSAKADGTGDGYDVYAPHPYLLIVRGSISEGAPASPGNNPKAEAKAAIDRMQGMLSTSDISKLKAELDKAADPPPSGNAQPSPTAATEFTAKIAYLPDYSKRYRVTTSNFLAKADFALTFVDGWQLTSVADKSDNSALVTALPALLGTLLGAPASAAATSTKQTMAYVRLPQPNTDDFKTAFALYRMDYNKSLDDKGVPTAKDGAAVVSLTRVPLVTGADPTLQPAPPPVVEGYSK